MKRRTFKDCIDTLDPINFLNYGRIFINWIVLNGYIDNIFSSTVYVFDNDKLEVLDRRIILDDYTTEDKEDVLAKNKKLLDNIQQEGYRSEIYRDNLDKLTDIKTDLEVYFCDDFIRTLFPKANYDSDLIKEVSAEEVLISFRETLEKNVLKDKKETADYFMNDLSLFLENISCVSSSEHGFIFLKNIKNYSWEDFGIIIYNKDRLSDDILFYQIGDNN